MCQGRTVHDFSGPRRFGHPGLPAPVQPVRTHPPQDAGPGSAGSTWSVEPSPWRRWTGPPHSFPPSLTPSTCPRRYPSSTPGSRTGGFAAHFLLRPRRRSAASSRKALPARVAGARAPAGRRGDAGLRRGAGPDAGGEADSRRALPGPPAPPAMEASATQAGRPPPPRPPRLGRPEASQTPSVSGEGVGLGRRVSRHRKDRSRPPRPQRFPPGAPASPHPPPAPGGVRPEAAQTGRGEEVAGEVGDTT